MNFRFRPFTVLLALLCVLVAAPAPAIDLLPGFFEKEKVKATIWELNEQYVRLVQAENGADENDHPVVLEGVEVQHALASLQLWIEGGVFRDEEAIAVYPRKQAALIASYLVDALSKASPEEDVTFNVRSYSDVMLGVAREREWTTGRVFYRDGRLNLIIGEHGKRIDKGKKTVEGSFGIVDDFRDVHFQVGSRKRKGKMTGRVVTTEGVELGGPGEGRPDWITIDVADAAKAYRAAQVPVAVRKEELKAREAAAKLTLERREMRAEMARMRKELQELRDNPRGGGSGASVEERLAKLQSLMDKGLIDEDDFERRKDAILQEL